MEFEKENNLNMRQKEFEGMNSSLRELKITTDNAHHASFAPSKSSQFTSYPRNNNNNSNNSGNNSNNYRKRNPPSHHVKGRSQAQSQYTHPNSSYAMKTLSRSSSFHDDSCVESKTIEKIPSSETASVSGHSTESTHSSGSSTPVSLEITSHSQPSQSTAYRSNEQSNQPIRRHSLNKPNTHRPSNTTNTTSATPNPYSFQPTPKDYQISQAMMLQRNQMYQTIKMDSELVYVITQLSYQAKDYLYQQQENLSKFYEDKRTHELSRLSSARSNKTSSSEVSSHSSNTGNESKGQCK